jgi:hypothetical protein
MPFAPAKQSIASWMAGGDQIASCLRTFVVVRLNAFTVHCEDFLIAVRP